MEPSVSPTDDERAAAQKTGFEVSSRQAGGSAEIMLRGELDLGDAGNVTQTVREALRGRVSGVELDVRELTFVDSAGLQALLDCREAARDAGAKFRIVGASDPVRRMVSLAGLDDLLH